MVTWKRAANIDESINSSIVPLYYAVREHPDAPMYRGVEDAGKIIEEFMTQWTSDTLSINADELIDVARQTGLVNLWFFLQVIAGATGPYNDLMSLLALDMCNFRQSDYCMAPGARAAAFIPRGYRKSTIFSHGANTWELTRDPTLAIRIVNAIDEKASEFGANTKNTIEANPLYGACYPKHVPLPNQARWNNNEIVMPNRGRTFTEASLSWKGISGAQEGGHYNVLNLDDLIGLDDIDANGQINANMNAATKWINTNTITLLRKPSQDRIILVATRYAADDSYAPIVENASVVVGVNDEDLKPVHNGKWAVYYRLVIEDDEAIMPDIMTKEEYYELLNRDPWTAITQYMNKPQEAGLAEFYKMQPKKCSIYFDDMHKDWVITREPSEEDEDQTRIAVLGKELSWCMSIDPAGTKKGINARTSKTSVGITAMDGFGNAYRVWGQAGYFDIDDMFNAIYEGLSIFAGYVIDVIVESNAMQKILANVIDKEIERRNRVNGKRVYFNAIPKPVATDKVARIRNTIGWFLKNGKLYVAPQPWNDFNEERVAFPSKRMDVLDEAEKGIDYLQRPANTEELAWIARQEVEVETVRDRTANLAGY